MCLISAMPMRPSRRTRLRASAACRAWTCSSSPAPTSTASRCCKRRRSRASRRQSLPTATRRVSATWSPRSTAPTTISSAPARSGTSAPAEELWRRMEKNGDIYLDKYAGWYSVRDEAYYDESELKQSADDGQKLSPQGTPVEWVEEESYFFRLSAYQDKLLAHYEAHPEFIGPDTRANEVKSFVRGGLQDLSISRTTFDWGIPVPGDPKHIMYVWVDALTNYLTGVGFPDEQSAQFKRYWPADVHIIGKDIIRFHAVYWPAFLMSAGLRAAEARVRPRLSLQSRGEDVEVGRQRGRSLRPRRRLRRRSAPLFPAARGAVRPGRQLQPRGHRPAHQRRPRQRSRQSRAALAVDDRQELRWRGAGAGRVHASRHGDPGRGRRVACARD